MGQAKYADRPLTPNDMGGEFSFGEEVHGKVTVRLGPGLVRTWDGEIRRRPRWFASWFDCVVAVMALVFALGVGFLLNEWSNSTGEQRAFAFVLIGALIALLFAIAYRLQQVGWN